MLLVPLGVLGAGIAIGLHFSRRSRVLTIPVLFAFGLVVGPTGLGLLHADVFLDNATQFGLLLMLFYTSLFGNPRALKDGGRIGLPLAAYDLVINFAAAWWIGDLLGWTARDRLFLAGIIATSSTAVVLKVLGDEGRIHRREGNVLISMLLIEDWVFLGFFAFLGLRYGHLPHRSPLTLVLGAVAFLVFLVALRSIKRYLWSIGSRELLIATLTSAGIGGAYLGAMAGLPGVGTAFTTGLMLSGEEGARFSQKEAPFLRDGASALFFVGYAATLGPHLSLSILPLLGLALAAIVVTELLFLPVIARRLGLRRSEGFIAGALLLPRGGKSAAFASAYPQTAGAPALFPLAGLLAIVLTPLAPLVAKIGMRLGGVRRLPYANPGEAFSRSARSLLLPHAYRPSGAALWNQVVLGELILLEGLLAVFLLAAPHPLNWVAAPPLAALLVPLVRMLRQWVRHAPGSPHVTHPLRVRREHNPAFDHLPLLLTAPLALLVLLAALSPWATLAYPVLLGIVWLAALALPWLRPQQRRAPPLARAFPG